MQSLFTWNNLPVVEHRHAECLALGVSPQVSLEPEGVDGRDEGLDRVQRRAGNWGVLEEKENIKLLTT